jgi:hypothetical protein
VKFSATANAAAIVSQSDPETRCTPSAGYDPYTEKLRCPYFTNFFRTVNR